jgi:hypothetical protein
MRQPPGIYVLGKRAQPTVRVRGGQGREKNEISLLINGLDGVVLIALRRCWLYGQKLEVEKLSLRMRI